MKLWILLLLWSVGMASAAEVQVRVVRQRKEIPAPTNAPLISNVVALVRGCSIDSTGYAVKPETWQQTLRSDSFVHVTFSAPRKIRVMGSDNQHWEERPIDEILVPLPESKWPAHIFTRSGTQVLSYAKYDARDLKAVAFEPTLNLWSVPPYKDLQRIPDRQR